MIESLKKAWALVGQKLKNHSRLRVYCPRCFKHVFSLNRPTGSREGVFADRDQGQNSTGLLDPHYHEGRTLYYGTGWLSRPHTQRLHWEAQGAESASAVWRGAGGRICFSNVERAQGPHNPCSSLPLPWVWTASTVHHPLPQTIKYDLPAIEKHVLNRFIYGKPVLLLDIPCVAYRKDIYTAETFQDIRRKVKPQVKYVSLICQICCHQTLNTKRLSSFQMPLRQRIQQDIITELRTPDKLKESLDVVDIVFGLLSSGAASHDISLHKYILSRRMGKKPFSTKVSIGDLYLLCLKLLNHIHPG